MDFAGLLSSGETIAGVSTPTIDKVTVPPIVVGTTAYSGTLAQVRLSGGLTGTRYKVTILVITSTGNILEGEAYLNVEDL